MDWKKIDAAVAETDLLTHPFYQAWSAGELTIEDLKYYAKQYYHLERNFPRLLSRVHSNCDDTETRRTILENIVDEERGDENHRELWLRFAEGLGLKREEVIDSQPTQATREAIESLMAACSGRPVEGLAALYAYESQLPKVSETKIAGLNQFYGIKDARTVSFFETHKEVDVWHSDAERGEIERLGGDMGTVEAGARTGAEALWRFLDGVDAETRVKRGADCAC
jgi:pyrroloquinoline-quinone synthase